MADPQSEQLILNYEIYSSALIPAYVSGLEGCIQEGEQERLGAISRGGEGGRLVCRICLLQGVP